MTFPCNQCGLCCRNLQYSPIYSDLDRGDGVCRYLDGNQCSIYTDRPLKCRIDDCYELYFKDKMTKEEYYKANEAVCHMLQSEKEV